MNLITWKTIFICISYDWISIHSLIQQLNVYLFLFLLSLTFWYHIIDLIKKRMNLISKVVLTTSFPKIPLLDNRFEFPEKRGKSWWRQHRHSIPIGLSLTNQLRNLLQHCFPDLHFYFSFVLSVCLSVFLSHLFTMVLIIYLFVHSLFFLSFLLSLSPFHSFISLFRLPLSLISFFTSFLTYSYILPFPFFYLSTTNHRHHSLPKLPLDHLHRLDS